ncbi:MAG: hypothetical protein IKG96_04415 [Bacteroidaceae bacterium]|nr:hypothetical protein [Bacteroidaceae bacterium]
MKPQQHFNKTTRRFQVLVCLCIMLVKHTHAQFFPYNPYYNSGYVAGQQIGAGIINAIAERSKYGRNQLRKHINKWGVCKSGTLTLERGAVAIYGSNGYFCTATVDENIKSTLDDIHDAGHYIDDINITENGSFIIVYGNGKHWIGNMPNALMTTLHGYPLGTIFRSISFNESGTYAITTSTGFKSNNDNYQAFYDDTHEEYGHLLSVNICDDGAVFCYSSGSKYCGYIPQNVDAAMNSFSGTPRFVKFNKHGDYLICSESGVYAYSINDADEGSTAPMVFNDYAKEKDRKAQERWEAERKKAYAKWDAKASFIVEDDCNRVLCLSQTIGKLTYMCTIAVILANGRPDYAPAIDISITNVLESDAYSEFVGLLKEETERHKAQTGKDYLENETVVLKLDNGECLSVGASLSSKVLGASWVFSTLKIKSNRKDSFNSEVERLQYIIKQLMDYNIQSITFRDITIDISEADTHSQFIYDFHQLATKGNSKSWMPYKIK